MNAPSGFDPPSQQSQLDLADLADPGDALPDAQAQARLDTDPPAPGLDVPGRAGFRLHRFEVYNWGTFHQRVWRMHPGGDNMLLTGDIGSGKSTLVDALTTLLVPANKISYNKAAGAEARERSLRTYVLGHYKSERGDTGMTARAVPLRDHHSYSVLLGEFRNEGSDQVVTLAQVFWLKDPRGQPERFYVVADAGLSIAEHFAGFGTDITQLRKRLRAIAGVTLFDTFPPYGAEFRRRFGIASEQAMDLFNQTVSMKSVGNLTEFVREHMLEPFPVQARIDALIAHFDDLNRAHEAVLKAQAQIDALLPLSADCDRHAALVQSVEELRACRDALRPWFAGLKAALLDKRIANLEAEEERATGMLAQLQELRRAQARTRDELTTAISANGGNRIEQIRSEIARLQLTRQEKSGRADKYQLIAGAVGLPGALDTDTFNANRRAIEQGQADCIAQRDERSNRLTEAGVTVRELRRLHGELTGELDSLRQRRSNIPRQMLMVREALCDSLAIPADKLPFAGELIQVRDEERAWEGAAERLLHAFGLSLLVPEAYYAQVAAWADRTHLGARLVYYRVRPAVAAERQATHPQSLARKVAIQPDSPFYAWIEAELVRRFDYACCDSMDQFRREQRAITANGQVKAGGERHEKDDRHQIDDRTRYVLGWTNEAKIAALAKQERDLATRILAHAQQIHTLKGEVDEWNKLHGLWQQLAVYADFAELDWKPLVSAIDQLEREQQELAASSDLLRTLQEQLREIEAAQLDTDAQLSAADKVAGTVAEKLKQARHLREEAVLLSTSFDDARRATLEPTLEALRAEALGEHVLTVESADNRERDMREFLQARIDAEGKKIERLRDAIISAMQNYVLTWPLDAREVDVNIEAAAEFRRMLHGLQADDLPRFASRFKELLNENTIREIAGFQSQLKRERETIRERIDTINTSLYAIDYNPNRYIALEAEPSLDADLRDFQHDLRSCTEGALSGSSDEEYTESKFLQVRRIIERFRGREGSAELDRRWTRKVTDVRNWFVFSASERWREDDREHEHYSDAGGKSGGQKEKLAYTVLAASLAYQFGLEWGAVRSRSFRFVVIDEAFGRGSDESARYGLELFRRMNLQLLIVTPLQKIHIIEPYVAGLGFVHSEEGRQSMLRYLSIEEFRSEREARGG
ncbi:ATP-binding protein [uncultured Massilia sp.]|uniref:ATP-binding protein n=1 Tax=uncultured Massilia sp. TaxID=169973 RepID=UPI002589857D|nr:ATP-binding protein [uncultured Massilia sp.]